MKTRNLGIFLRIIVLAIVAVLLYINTKKTKKIKQQLQTLRFSELDSFLEKLLQHKLETNYIGLSIDSKNCLYFVNHKNRINIEFEVIEKEQIELAEKLVAFATTKKFEVIETSYGNKRNYDKTKDAPIYQILCKLNLAEASIFTKEIFQHIFNCDETAIFKIVD